jgi:arylsulfatase
MPTTIIAAVALAVAAPAERPNVVVLLVDDMGYSDPGYMGGEARTPNLDRLSAQGVTFLNCFNNAKCAPSRAALMTGLTCQRVKAFKSAGNIAENNAACIAEVLGASGYVTVIAGKWHVNPDPRDVGFRHQFGVKLAPHYFKRDAVGRPGEKAPGPITLNGEKVDPTTFPEDWYSTTAWTDFAIKTVREEALPERKPFFVYLAVNAPHAPLSAPREVVDRYTGVYEGGTDVARRGRYDRMVERGIVDPRTWKLPPFAPGKDGSVPKWDAFASKEKRLFRRKLALAAAMVDVIDREAGKLVRFLREAGQFENTLFIFLSDNGATAEQGIYGGLDFERLTEGDIDRLGTRAGLPGGTSGAVVAGVQNTPLRGYKTTLWDGGMRTSMIVHWPGRMAPAATTGYVRTPVSIMDIAPTIYEAAGVEYPREIAGRRLQPMDGASLVPLIVGDARGLPRGNAPLAFAYKQHRVVRTARWKLFSTDRKGPRWMLFGLDVDRSETTDVSREHPDVVRELGAFYQKWDEEIGVTSGYAGYFSKKKDKARDGKRKK